jgi:hypothetical protein
MLTSVREPTGDVEAVLRLLRSGQWYDAAGTDYDSFVERLYETYPLLREDAFWSSRPTVRLVCPSCGATLVEVTAHRYLDRRPVLVTIRRRASVSRADPVAAGDNPAHDITDDDVPLSSERVVIACGLKRCRFRQTVRRERLLGFFVAAVLAGVDAIPLRMR